MTWREEMYKIRDQLNKQIAKHSDEFRRLENERDDLKRLFGQLSLQIEELRQNDEQA